MKDATIRSRLTVVVLLSLLCVLLLGYLFVTQSEKDISFAYRELQGTDYVEDLLPDLVARFGGQAMPADGRLADVAKRLDGTLDLAPWSNAYLQVRETIAGTYDAAYWTAADELRSKIGDNSLLILDPDIDSFYLMDILVVKLGALLEDGTKLRAAVEQAAGAGLDSDALVEALALAGAFKSNVEGTGNSYESALTGQNGDQVKGWLQQPIAGLEEASKAFDSAVAAVLKADATTDRAPLKAAADKAAAEMSAATTSVVRAANLGLQTLLKQRMDGLVNRLVTTLLAASGLVALVFLVSWLFARSILKAVLRLEADIRKMADDPAMLSLAQAEKRNEIAAIARAVQYLRDQTVEKLAEADRARQAESERAAIAEREAAAQREANLKLAANEAEAQREMIAELSLALARLADGDLRCRVDRRFAGGLEQIREAFNTSVSALEKTISLVKASSVSIRTATEELLAGATDLADRTSRQAGSLQETSEAVRALARTVEESARLAETARSNGELVSASASHTGRAMGQTAQAMSRIEESSQRIANIVGLIDDIAFQTNLLALNASVEAARAGEAGKGFAVVAVEVRRLAQSAATASSDVKQLIEESRAHVADGSRYVTDAGTYIADMEGLAGKSRELLADIARRSAEQNSSISVVERSMQQMDSATQQNAALVEETNAAIAQTEAQANQLDTVVARFVLDGQREQRRAVA